jgi:3-hydroxyisobutyrate dehydrogenase
MPHTQEKQHTQTVGWIGLGKMGSPIVRNLLAAGFDVTVYDVDAERVGEAIRLGAHRAEDVASVARSAPLVFSIIPDDAVLRKVALGTHGVIENANDGAVYIDMSTVSPTASGEVREAARKRGVGYICAPVSGSTVLAGNAQLTVFASGAKEAYGRALPVFQAMSARQYYVGEDQQARYL